MFRNSLCSGVLRVRELVVDLRHSMLAAALFAIPVFCLAQNPGPESRFARVTEASGVSTSFRPADFGSGKRVHVVVVLSADSVASVRATMPLHTMAQSQVDSVASQALEQQAAVKPMLAAYGATVLAQYQHALNGIKVEVDSSKVATLASLPGVVNVLPVGLYKRANAVAVPFIGAPLVWQGIPGFRGEGIKIAVIDTGIDYTHANFGGPGTVAAYNAAFATDTLPADPAMFGPGAPKVKGGTDLVGDDYDADPNNSTYQPVPHPDPNPLDCPATSGSVGHGSHTAGSAAGFGVLNGATYTGPYNSAAYQQHFSIGPGVAPKADIYSVRVFGCNGSTDVVTEAIEWAVAHNVDIISMSLGENYGDANTSDAVASHNAVALAGITVVASSGNSGSAPYITSSPAAGTGVITAAAMDSTATVQGVNIALNTGATVGAQNSNLAPLPGGSLPIIVLRNPDNSISLGCNDSEYANVAGKLVVTLRGSCARVARAQFGQAHGAAAVAMINTDPGFPPVEGTIPGVTIPFLGVPSTRGPTLAAAASATLSAATVANPGFETIAGFSSGGPRTGDSFFQPSVAAPGVSIFSTAAGTGTGGQFLSGTSMAAPMIAGVAALVRQAHPGWSEMAQRAAITQTADRFQMVGYSARLAGNGVVQALPATQTQAVVLGTTNAPEPLSYGFTELTTTNYSNIRNLDIRNNGTTPIQFNVKVTPAGGVPHLLAPMSPTVTVPATSDASLPIKISVPVGTVGGTDGGYKDVAGTVTLTPANPSMNGGVSLNVPYYLVPIARSLIQVSHNVPSPTKPNATLNVSNGPATIAGTADFYAWGLSGTPTGLPYIDIRGVGVQSNPISASDSILVFAINTFTRFSNAAGIEWDVFVDIDGDGKADYQIVAVDGSLLNAALPAGQLMAAVFNLATGAGVIEPFNAQPPTDGTTVELPVFASDLGLSPAHPRFTYQVQAFNPNSGDVNVVPGKAPFNVFTSSISNAMFVTVSPNQTTGVPVSINPTEWAITPALGVMAVSIDNLNGVPQADLIPVSP